MMQQKGNTYGISAENLDKAKIFIDDLLKVELEPRDSMYRGGDYWRLSKEDVELILQENFMEVEGETTEPEFSAEKILLYVDGDVALVNEIEALLLSQTNIKLLRSKKYG